MVDKHNLTQTIVTAAAGVIIGWVGTSLTVVGRVAALEAGQARIETAIGQVLSEVSREARPVGK